MSDTLMDALGNLRSTLHDFDRQAPLVFPNPVERLKPLAVIVQNIGHEGPMKIRDCPTEYRQQWREFLTDRRTDLEPRAVRFLCWEPEVGTDPRFHSYLGLAKGALTARSLQGLVASLHQRWSKELIEGPVGTSLRRLLRSYSGTNLRIQKWQASLPIVVGGDGPALLGDRLTKEPSGIDETANLWGFVEDSGFMRQAIAAAAATCRAEISAGSPLVNFLTERLLCWKGWEEGHLKTEFSDCVSSQQAGQYDDLREGLKRLGLDHFGDPRLPTNQGRWTGVRRQARDEFVRWLSQQDIEFFFQLVLPRASSDPHGRRNFWLKYVGRVRRSRPLLCQDDKSRLRTLHGSDLQKIGHYGRIVGSSSAFLLDFGEVLIVEFSAYGNACFVYERTEASRVVPEFWKVLPFSRNGLKAKDVGGRLPHQVGWHEAMSNFLAGHGIRPGV